MTKYSKYSRCYFERLLQKAIINDEDKVLDKKKQSRDKLFIWKNFLVWAERSETVDKREYNEILEDFVQEMKHCKEYHNRLKLILYFIRFAEMQKKPLDFFIEMKTLGIGLSHAKFYSSYAEAHEKEEQFLEACKIYQDGVRKKAQPIEYLKSKQYNFLLRLNERIIDENKPLFSSNTNPTVNEKENTKPLNIMENEKKTKANGKRKVLGERPIKKQIFSNENADSEEEDESEKYLGYKVDHDHTHTFIQFNHADSTSVEVEPDIDFVTPLNRVQKDLNFYTES